MFYDPYLRNKNRKWIRENYEQLAEIKGRNPIYQYLLMLDPINNSKVVKRLMAKDKAEGREWNKEK